MNNVNAIPAWPNLNSSRLPCVVYDGMDLYVGVLFDLHFLGHVFILGECNGSGQEK